MTNDSRGLSGFSLVELMIATALGSILMLGVLQVFTGTKMTYMKTESIGRVNENGRFAIDLLSRYARLAGYWDYDTRLTEGALPTPFLPDCATAGEPCTQDGTGTNASDRLAIQSDLPDNKDCNGNAAPANGLIVNVFWVQEDGFGASSLYCRGYNPDARSWIGTPQPLVAGIDSMQLLYGVIGSNGSVSSYVNASHVVDWHRVSTIKIVILAQSGQHSDLGLSDRRYALLDAEPLVFDDSRTRFIFATTVFVANLDTGVM